MGATVYFTEVEDEASPTKQAKALGRLWEAADISSILSKRDLTAVKIHVGEKGNKTHIRPELIREIVTRVKEQKAQPFLTETSTLYRGARDNAVKHILLAHGHGFSIERVGAPFILSDGLVGNTEEEVEISGELHKSVKVAKEILAADALLVVSHATGHSATGFGACLKNLGMGLASRMGKLRQHSAMRPEIDSEKCRLCLKCQRFCPQEAIETVDGSSRIDGDRCHGCGECLAVCRYGAVRFDWKKDSETLQKSIAEHAYGVVKDREGKCFYINVLVDMTKECDCCPFEQQKIVGDLGIMASDDPVALDSATLDLTRERYGKDLSELSQSKPNPMMQIRHAEKLGMGTSRYTLRSIR